MRPELRFFLALALMIGVFVLTELLFPPIQPEAPPEGEGGAVAEREEAVEPAAGEVVTPPEPPGQPAAAEEPSEKLVTVETPLYKMTFSSHGGTIHSIQLLGYESFTREGPVELVPEGEEVLRGLWVAGSGGETYDLARYPYTFAPEDGVQIGQGDGPQTLTFRYDYPGGQFFSEIRYTFSSDSYIVGVEGNLPAIERASLFVDLGPGLAVNELREADDRRMMAFAGNHVDEGITSRPLARLDEPELLEGPLRWAAVKSKYFVEVLLPGRQPGGTDLLTGIRAETRPAGGPLRIRVGTPVTEVGSYAYRAYLGPIERERLVAIGDDLEEVNPYGWRIFRPIVRPFVGVVLWLVRFLHESLLLSYGWVLIVIGILLRIAMWPLNRKMMLSQVKTMAVQPLAEEIKRKYGGQDPQRMQQETMKLYKEHGVNPLAGCLPMMIPMPVLIALFFVFQNTIEMRGVPFMWLPDLSAPDPFYILPVFMGASLYLTQLITMRISGGAGNPQMKMMLYFMPILLVVIFWRFPSGLNLYYATMNLASIPQQILIGKERKRVQAAGPPKRPA